MVFNTGIFLKLSEWWNSIATFFFFLTAVQGFFFYFICAACNFFLPTSACRKFFFKIIHPPPQKLNGRHLKRGFLPDNNYKFFHNLSNETLGLAYDFFVNFLTLWRNSSYVHPPTPRNFHWPSMGGGGGGGGYGYFLEPHNLSNSWNTRGLQWVKPLRLSCLIRFIFRVKGQPNTIIMLCNFQVTLHSRHLQILTCRV